MPEEATLLAYLVPRLTSRREDTATDGLAFILNKSTACRDALNLLLRDEHFALAPIVRVQTQVTYEDGSRPDLAGYDETGAKRVLVEAKFWATLLEGQASGYYGQLEEVGPGVLLFIAPDARFEVLWAEIRRQMESGEDGVRIELVESTKGIRKARIVGLDKRVILVTWSRLLAHLAAAVPHDAPVASDIQQLNGLARREDDEAFQPIESQEFAPSVPRRIRWLNRLVDAVVDGRGVEQGWMTTTGLRATPQRHGYGRYFRFTDVPGELLFLCVNIRLWSTHGDTPLWLRIGWKTTVNIDKLRERVPTVAEGEDGWAYEIPIYLKTGVEYEDVLDDFVCQLHGIAEALAHV